MSANARADTSTVERVPLGRLIREPAPVAGGARSGAVCVLYTAAAFASGEPERIASAALDGDAQEVRASDVLISAGMRQPRRAWVVGADRGHAQWATRDWVVLRSARHDPDYLRHVLVSNAFRLCCLQAARRRGRSAGSFPQRLARIEIPVPAQERQRRMVQVLDLANALRARRRDMAPLLDELARAHDDGDCAQRSAAISALRAAALRSSTLLDGLIGTLRDLAYTGDLDCT